METGQAAPYAPGRPRSLADSLRAWDDQALAALLAARSDLLRPTPKDLAALAARATSGPSTARCLDGLNRLDLLVLHILVRTPGIHLSVAALVDAAEAEVACADDAREDLRAAIEESVTQVRALALVWGPDDDLRATHAIRDALGAIPGVRWPPPQLAVGAPVDGCDAEGGWQAVAFLARTRALLDEWSVRPPAVLRTGGLGVREFAAARTVMHAEVPAAALAIEVASAAGLLASDEQASPRYLPTEAYDDWVQDPPEQAWALLGQAWLGMPRLPSLAGERANLLSNDQDRRAVVGMRRQVLGLLAEGLQAAPVSAASIEAVLDDRLPRGSGPLRRQVIEATFIEGTLLGILAAGALTQAGRALIADTAGHAAAMAAAMPPFVDHLLVQADLTVIAPGPVTAPLQRTMALLADIESSGHATVYRLSAASVSRALEAGMDGPAIKDQLAALSRSPIPSTVTTLIDDAARQHGGIRVGVAASYVRCTDPVQAALLLQDRALERLGLTQVDEHVLISSAPASQLLPALRAAGFPAIGERPEGSILVPDQSPRRSRHATQQVQVRKPSIPATVRALRAAESATMAIPPASGAGLAGIEVDTARRCSGAAALALLREAIAEARAVALDYAEPDGGTDERVLDPIRVGGGTLTAFDHQAGQVRTFTLARVASVAPLSNAQGSP